MRMAAAIQYQKGRCSQFPKVSDFLSWQQVEVACSHPWTPLENLGQKFPV